MTTEQLLKKIAHVEFYTHGCYRIVIEHYRDQIVGYCRYMQVIDRWKDENLLPNEKGNYGYTLRQAAQALIYCAHNFKA